ncbi:LysE family transporter [Sinorhizobium sp. Sb3]|uniref:LysE family transporter n=1 Tax=Sinorhizobium sp. Sb3 TaxID=1358417 RepID=UPI000ABF8838|nr:LysE family transporter [Sinorhizobium sp. Sb3]
MTLAVISTCALALFLAAVTPGPAMFAVISTSISRGVGPALACGFGIALSDMVLVSVHLLASRSLHRRSAGCFLPSNMLAPAI